MQAIAMSVEGTSCFDRVGSKLVWVVDLRAGLVKFGLITVGFSASPRIEVGSKVAETTHDWHGRLVRSSHVCYWGSNSGLYWDSTT